jgi:hypothetical protein
VCHNKFRLALLSHRGIGGSGSLDLSPLRKNFNVVNFEFSEEALSQRVLRKVGVPAFTETEVTSSEKSKSMGTRLCIVLYELFKS